MPHLEPTYLRYIYDSLIKGSIHSENAAELPDGLIGMYEEAFDERTSVVERQKLLQRFTIWALLKKEVSASFVAEVLGELEEKILNFISTYSAWFNSPESGKYQLYHEGLKVYLLQKLSEGEVHTLHEKLISRLERAIEEQKADEIECYGLEFLGVHLGISAMLNGDGKKLIELAYCQTHWQRQLKISKGYTWTKNGLKEVMAWASKYNDDEVIECGLQMVDLHHQEQNTAPQIVALVAEGDFDAALKRIEQFGGNDNEGLKRKFILYMLCLMELTLLESKDKPFRKEGIDKLLKHLDEQLPVDHSVLNWSEFFPSYLMFQMAREWLALELNYFVVYKRADHYDFEWLDSSIGITEFDINLLTNCIALCTSVSDQSIYLSTIAQKINYAPDKNLREQLIQQALILSDEILIDGDDLFPEKKYIEALLQIAEAFFAIGLTQNAIVIIDKSIISANKISNQLYIKFSCLAKIHELLKRENIKSLADSVFFEAAETVENIPDYNLFVKVMCECAILEEYTIKNTYPPLKISINALIENSLRLDKDEKDKALSYIASILAKQNNFTKCKGLIDLIQCKVQKFKALLSLCAEFYKINSIHQADLCLNELDQLAEYLEYDMAVIDSLKPFLDLLIEQLRLEEIIRLLHVVKNLECRVHMLQLVSSSLQKINYSEEASKLLDESLQNIHQLEHGYFKSLMLNALASTYLRSGNLKGAAECLNANVISEKYNQSFKFRDDFLSSMVKSLDRKRNLLNGVAIAKLIREEHLRSQVISELSISINEKIGYRAGLKNLNDITFSSDKIEVLLSASKELFKMNEIIESNIIVNKAKTIALSESTPDQINLLNRISEVMFEIGNLEIAKITLDCSLQKCESLSTIFVRKIALIRIAKYFANQNRESKVFSILENVDSLGTGEDDLNDVANIFNIIQFMPTKDDIYKSLVINSAKKRQWKKVNLFIDKISSNHLKANICLKLSSYFMQRHQNNLVEVYYQQALSFADLEQDYYLRIKTLLNISSERAKQGLVKEAKFLLNEQFNVMNNSNEEKDYELISLFASAFAVLNDWKMTEIIFDDISNSHQLEISWEKIAKEQIELVGYKKALLEINGLTNTKNIEHYATSWLSGVQNKLIDNEFILKILPKFSTNLSNLELLLNKYVLSEIFHGHSSTYNIHRFNEVLNVQWAIDIKKQLPN